MPKYFLNIVLVMSAIFALSACDKTSKTKRSVPPPVNSTQSGQIAIVGGQVAKVMDRGDLQKLQDTFEYNKTKQTAAWTNTRSGVYFTVIPTKTFKSSANRDCREYMVSSKSKTANQTVYGVTCRDLNGLWIPAEFVVR